MVTGPIQLWRTSKLQVTSSSISLEPFVSGLHIHHGRQAGSNGGKNYFSGVLRSGFRILPKGYNWIIKYANQYESNIWTLKDGTTKSTILLFYLYSFVHKIICPTYKKNHNKLVNLPIRHLQGLNSPFIFSHMIFRTITEVKHYEMKRFLLIWSLCPILVIFSCVSHFLLTWSLSPDFATFF